MGNLWFVLGKLVYLLWQFLCHWANFQWCKRPKIEKWYKHLFTLIHWWQLRATRTRGENHSQELSIEIMQETKNGWKKFCDKENWKSCSSVCSTNLTFDLITAIKWNIEGKRIGIGGALGTILTLTTTMCVCEFDFYWLWIKCHLASSNEVGGRNLNFWKW